MTTRQKQAEQLERITVASRALAHGATLEEAAAQAELEPVVIEQVIEEGVYENPLRKQRKHIRRQVAGRINVAAVQAVDRLVELMGSKDERVAAMAAIAILKAANPQTHELN